jgi:hypothetical protein
MKIRSGFVSNSSSSSFIVAFDKDPEDAKELKEIMFKDEETIYVSDFEKPCEYETIGIAERVLSDMKKKATKKEIVQAISCGWYDGCPNSPDYCKDTKENKKQWDIFEKEWKKGAEKVAKDFISKNKDKVIYVFSYADGNSNYEAMLEHSDIFENLSHLRISCH